MHSITPSDDDDDQGVASVEYALVAAAIAVAIAFIVFAIGDHVVGLFAGLQLP